MAGYKQALLPMVDYRSKTGLAFCTPDPNLLSCGSEDGSMYVWNVKEKVVLQHYKRKHSVSGWSKGASHAGGGGVSVDDARCTQGHWLSS